MSDAPSAIVPVILSGGSGTRLWPLSTPERPKQFLALTGERTMFQLTAQRCAPGDEAGTGFAPPIVVGNARHADMIDAQLKEIGGKANCVILEPHARNTAPAIALAALEAGGGDALLLVMPSDHAIADPAAFLTAVETAAPTAREGWLLTFGIQPTGPETGYGYIEMRDVPLSADSGVRGVRRFVEKPERAKAVAMLEADGFVWNAGIFLFRADRYLAALARYAPDIEAAARKAHDAATRDGTRLSPAAAAFAASPSQSIDYAVMEKADDVAVMPLSCGWSDIGSWDALGEIALPDPDGSVLRGRVIARESRNLIVRADDVRVSVFGIEDLVVIANGSEVLILPRGRSQHVRAIVDAVREQDGEQS